jgi:hypothetical protein
MTKLHLIARVPNEGARLLAQRIMQDFRGSMFVASTSMRMPITTLQRLVDGEVVPGEELVGDVGRATANAITRNDWRRSPQGGWFEMVAA